MVRWCSLLIMIVILFILVIDNADAIPDRDSSITTEDDIDILDHYPGKEPETAGDYYNLGILYLARRADHEADKNFQKALELDPKHVYSMVGLVTISLRFGDKQSAVDFSKKAIAIQPRSADLHNLIGERWMANASFIKREEALAEAETLFRQAISLDPKSVDAHINMGNAYLSRNMFDEGIKEYKVAVNLRPEDPDLRRQLAYAYLNTGSIDKGLQEAEKMVELSPDNPIYRNGLGEIYMDQRHLEKSLEEFQEATRLDPKYATAYKNIGKVYFAQGLPDKAIEEFHKALLHRPDYGEAYAGLGDMYIFKGDNQKAIEEYEKALSESAVRTLSISSFVSVHNNLAYIYCEDVGDLDRALSHAQKARRVAPQHPGVIDTLGWIYLKKGNLDEAVINLEAASKASPEHPIIRYHLGTAYYKKGLKDQAIAELEKSLSISDDFPGSGEAKQLLREMEVR